MIFLQNALAISGMTSLAPEFSAGEQAQPVSDGTAWRGCAAQSCPGPRRAQEGARGSQPLLFHKLLWPSGILPKIKKGAPSDDGPELPGLLPLVAARVICHPWQAPGVAFTNLSTASRKSPGSDSWPAVTDF